MSRRNRRQQEELEALAANAGAAAGSSSDDETDEIEQIGTGSSSFAAFAQLDAGAAEDEENEDDDEGTLANQTTKKKRKPKKKKKKPATLDALADQPNLSGSTTPASETDGGRQQSDPPSKTSSSQGTPSKRKGKMKARSSAADPSADDDGLDEIDRALKALGTDYSTTSGNADASSRLASSAAASKIRSLLAVDPKNLDADAELKRFFGSKVVASAAVKPQVRGARAQNPHHALHRQFARGGMLAKPGPNWPPAALAKAGLSMELVESGNGESLWTFQHSRAYIEVTHMYLEAVASMDPNQLMALLHVHPYHVETLLGLSDMAAQQGDPGMSQDFLDRALYAFERGFAPNFNLQNGNARLDFTKIESRGFFRAIDKRINSLMKRGTWRTLHEHAKLLYALSPFDDPYGALLSLDFTAPKARQYTWFIDFVHELPATIERSGYENYLKLDAYPGLWYALALSRWHLEEDAKKSHEESTQELRRAILRYPLTCHALLNKLGSSIPSDLSRQEHAQPESGYTTKPSYILQLLSALYVHKSDTLWKEPEVLEWLQATVRATAPSLDSQPDDPDVAFGRTIWKKSAYPKGAVPEGILRHILVADIQPLRLYLPQKVLNSVSNTYDPLPPGPGFDDDYFKPIYQGGRNRRSQASGYGPGGQTEGMMDRLMQFLRAGGAEGEDMDPDLQAAIIAQLEQYTAAGRGDAGLPGNFPGAQEDGSGDEQEQEQEGDAAQAAAAGGMMDFFRGLWGRGSEGQAQTPPTAAESAVYGQDDDDVEDESDGDTNGR